MKSFFTVFGGLAIFIYSMQLMGEGLRGVAGQRLRSILHLFAKNRFVAILTGTIVTSLIQSSGATTVMVVGFVNAGLLTLKQSIGIILGSHIGTTVTGQIVAFKISGISMPAIIIGVVMSFFKQRIVKKWGMTIMGFGFLFFSMEIMSDELRQLADSPGVHRIFQTFQCTPVDGVMPIGATFGALLIGIIATIIVQSSSASTGIAIVLAGNGLMDFYTASIIALGANIGTTSTAIVAAFASNRVAKQAALVHFLTATLGVLLVIATFWFNVGGEPIFFHFVRQCSKGASTGRLIANSNTIFNLVTTILFIPLISVLVKICEKLIPIESEKVHFQYLEPHLLATPSIALAQTTAALQMMLAKAWTMVDCALSLYCENDEKNQRIFNQLEKREEDVDARPQEIADYLSRLMQRQLTDEQTLLIPMLLHCNNDAERIGDLTFAICNIMDRLQGSGHRFSPEAEAEYVSLHKELREMTETVIGLLYQNTPDAIKLARRQKQHLSDRLAQYENDHIQRISKGLCIPDIGLMYLELLEEIRKISRHLTNITDRAGNFYKTIGKTYVESGITLDING